MTLKTSSNNRGKGNALKRAAKLASKDIKANSSTKTVKSINTYTKKILEHKVSNKPILFASGLIQAMADNLVLGVSTTLSTNDVSLLLSYINDLKDDMENYNE